MGDALAGLGLVVGDATIDVTLADDVVLTLRVPDSLDWSRARGLANDVFDPAEKLKAASARYGFDGDDRRRLVDPAIWSTVGDFVVAVELAVLTVTAVKRRVGTDIFAVDPAIDVFTHLFRRDSNLGIFMARVQEAERQLLAPKKGLTPSPDGSGAAAASTATDTGGSAMPVPGAG